MNNQPKNSRHILSALVEDVDGLVTRVSAMFSRRGFNLRSFVSGTTETPQLTRITIVFDADENAIEQITKQLNKIVPVRKVVRMDPESTVARALMLVKVSADASNRPQVVDAANIFRARIIDVAPESVVIEATGTEDKLAAFLEILRPFGVRELISSGPIALTRGPKTMAPKIN
ncbi:acetolactate synthase small subunit [Corynebacterium sp. ES2794-CONJ1]|uniref:acetolactate synthase small subunit n=1 Tax=unclassified Corynebacterium TaxID=2624378 RepID=UPI00216723F3|nr:MULTISPECIES: acetolactate synthase small subunit [unclassified Corynebacterium]MCS4489777.1 acetolactate synthase small subunit [Corynebacterium sp. ES2775-CONJ]MCS4491859.1 acetolactate synthase small subunit [Corynebacterium sp. ES2715-CONJ3]MCS4531964.1 acetolactate synthase small subunit [Corynebacterium sp. ES2730-CONJ]MCU9519365.1 acetolactate synthase small subunit [Corynebacterium sp. ES2794-CONJ1]